MLALTAAACRPDSPPPIERPGFGLVGCVIEPTRRGPSFFMTINDRAHEMFVVTSLSALTLPRDDELTDDYTHVAALTDGARTIAVTLDRDLHAAVMTINDRVSIGSGQCEPLS